MPRDSTSSFSASVSQMTLGGVIEVFFDLKIHGEEAKLEIVKSDGANNFGI